MATQIIKFNNGTDTYVPVTVASAVQYSYDGGVMSVQQAIGTIASTVVSSNHSISDEITEHKANGVNLSYSTTNGIYPTGVHGNGTGVKINAGTGINITNSGNTLTVTNTSTNQIQHLTGSGTALASATNSSVAYVNLDSNNGKVGIQGTAGSSAVNKLGQAEVVIAYDTASGQPNNIRIKVSYRDTDTNYYDKIIDKGLTGYIIAEITANNTGSSSALHVPQATSTNLGVVKLGYTDANKGYALKLDSNGKGYVNVPWTDTKQTIATNNSNQYWITGVASKTGDQTGAVDGTAYFKAGTLYETNIAATNMYKGGKSVATEEYVNSKLTGLIDFKGNWPSTAPTTIEKYDAWRINTATDNWNGTTHKVEVGDIVLALDDNPGSTTSKWTVIQNNIDVSGLVKSISGSGDTEVSLTPTTATGPDANGNVALTVSHASHNIGEVTASDKNVTGNSGQQKVITDITVNSFGHITGYTAANIYSTDTKSVISGDYRSASKSAYVKLTNNTGEVGIYNAGSTSDAGVTLSYTSGKGIGIKITYTDTNTHVGTHTLSASGSPNPTISLSGTDSSGSVQFKAGTLTSVTYSSTNGVQVNHTAPSAGSVTATSTKTIDIAKDDYGHVTAISRVDIATMGAATASVAGTKGFVPAPPANSLNKVLTGAATFKTISASQGNHTAGLLYKTMDTDDNFTLFDDSAFTGGPVSLATIVSPSITVSLS